MEEQGTFETEEEMEDRSPQLGRRSFLNRAGLGVAGFAASGAILAACGSGTSESADGGEEVETEVLGETEESDILQASQSAPEIEWEMATSWPTALTSPQSSAEQRSSPSRSAASPAVALPLTLVQQVRLSVASRCSQQFAMAV